MTRHNGTHKFISIALTVFAGLCASCMTLSQARSAGHADALLLTCMDYRLMDDIEHYMSAHGLKNKYDLVVLAGASLGAVTGKYPEWNKTFWEHLELAINLHHINTVIVMDHRDCGAYKLILGPEHNKDSKKENAVHAAQLKKLSAMIHEKYPKLKVEMLLMALDGNVETIQ